MVTLYNCLTIEHDYFLVLIAAAICLTMSIACSFMLSRMLSVTGLLRKVWLAVIAVIASTGIWTTHFIGMLAYEPGIGFTFDTFWTVTSLIVSFVFNAAAFALISCDKQSCKWVGGALLGVGIGAMHYTGMLGLLPAGIKEWNFGFVAVSLVFGAGLSVLFVHVHNGTRSTLTKLLSSLVLVLAICSAHFIGMSALTLIPYPSHTQELLGISPETLALRIAAIAGILIQTGFAAAILDSRLSHARERSKAELRESEERYALALKGSADGIWDWNIATGEFVCSDGLNEILGVETRQTVRNYLSVIHPDDRDRLTTQLKAHFEGSARFDEEIRLLCADEEFRWFRIRGQAVLDSNGRATRMVSSVSDIEEVVLARVRTEQATRKIERANQMKSEFIANMSHEIRTPLNGILGMAQLMEHTNLSDKQHKFVDRIQSSGKHLLAIINDVLDISKIEAGLMVLHPEPFTLNDLLRNVTDSLMGIAEPKGLHCTLRSDYSDQARFVGDPNRINQILFNLIGNAIKFTDNGGVVIHAYKTDDGKLEISVQDTGPGIAPDQLNEIFGRFRQEDNSATRKHGGTGLGLSISKELVHLMDGQIGVESELGKGSRFWFTLPLEQAEPAPNPEAAYSEPERKIA